MAVGAIGSLSSIAAESSTANSGAATNSSASSALQLDFSTYLKILTAQLQNQDPTNATDPNTFTQELIQMEQVQSQIATNTDLQNLTSATAANGLATGITYIGNFVRSPTSSDQFSLQNGAAEIGYTLPEAATAATISVQNSSGTTVTTLTGGQAAGDNYVVWNGQDASGNQLPDGAYTFTVNAVDSGGNPIVSSNPNAFFYVTGVQSNNNGTLTLDAGALSLLNTDVTGVFNVSTLPKAVQGTPIS